MSSYVRQSLRIKPPFGEEGDPPLPPDAKVLYEEDFWLVPNQIPNVQQINQTSNMQQMNQAQYIQQMNYESNNQQINFDESFVQTDEQSLPKKSSKNELAHADFIERLIVVASSNKKRQRRSSTSSIDSSYYKDKLIQDENSDLTVEKLLQKFENISAEKSNQSIRYSSNDADEDVVYGAERIIERRYYVKKPKLGSKRDQLTSTGDLAEGNGKKHRQLSGVSSTTAVTSTCSQCTSATPSYVESLRNQSTTLRDEISGLKGEIEQLHTSQRQFFQQIQTQFQPKTYVTTTATQSFDRPTISPARLPTEKTEAFGNMTIPLTTGQRSRSISTESIASSSIATTSGKSTPTVDSSAKPVILPMTKPNASLPQIAEFIAQKSPPTTPTPIINAYIGGISASVTSASPINGDISSKHSSMAPTPLVNTQISSKPSSIAPRPMANTYVNSKASSIASTPPINTRINSKPSSIAPTPMANAYVSSKASSIASTPPINTRINSKPSSIAATPPIHTHNNSKPSSITSVTPTTESAATNKPSIAPTNGTIRTVNSTTSSTPATPQVTQSPRSPARIPIYENELAHRRALSPRSQIVASSLSAKDSSDASSRSTTPESIKSTPQRIPKIPDATLRDNDLNDLVQYSSHLEVTGFPSSRTAVINNPNSSSIFWDSVDQFIETSRPTDIVAGKPPIPRSNTGNRIGLQNNTTRQLDKYDLEIKPQETITSSAPFLMPPLDNLP